MNQLEKRFNEKIKGLKFTTLELAGMGVHPKLAIKAGMCVGYQMSMDDTEASLQEITECIKQNER